MYYDMFPLPVRIGNIEGLGQDTLQKKEYSWRASILGGWKLAFSQFSDVPGFDSKIQEQACSIAQYRIHWTGRFEHIYHKHQPCMDWQICQAIMDPMG